MRAVLVRQNPTPLTHAGSFLGLALDQSESMNTLSRRCHRQRQLLDR